ncbi:NAD(P)-dependent dehydrogenase (short-subunit alcohol dehydrogenase family) [Duganella sp. 1224]|uniref:SDR family oxidoreductase n=1 Tax=Duganella sp. 1224 TaxID=2587052 RepID=UPI0015C84DF8|nr:SDR family oxidoreductase [Duganella sp. 1224]NYE59410.1 NAD(P)-dependent dehydrogenase (short-subunit alcohol dehydrogenase family) [Duganella sp. 1224]
MKIDQSIVLVTGANRGLGLAFARALVARGAKKVYAGMRDTAGFSEPGVTPVRLDLHDATSIKAAAEQCGDVTFLLNNAGIARYEKSVLSADGAEDARAMFETNYFGTVRVTQAFAPALLRNGPGAILNVLSVASWIAKPLLAAYAASKSAEWSFTNALRVELKETEVLVSGMHVGFIDTDLTKDLQVTKLTVESVVNSALDGIEAGLEEILIDDVSRAVKASLGTASAVYLAPPDIR